MIIMPQSFSINVIESDNHSYPSLLKEISKAPEKLYILGGLPLPEMPKVAIVGTRKATEQGKFIAKNIAQKLAESGIVIVSGLAMGIDTAAHEGALAAGGKTIAVLANGLDKIYPAQNENLARKILESGGAIVSEYESKTPPYESQFLERNRIVSGLSVAAIIIEAPERSGSLATARFAAEQGREVFVVPGPINHPNYAGSHKLIRDGARLVASIEDILEDLNLEISKSEILNPKITDKNQMLILQTIQEAGQPLKIDKIVELTKLKPQTVNQALALLIVNGAINETEKGYNL